MKNYTDEEMFELAANKSLVEIKLMNDETVQREAIRYWFNRLITNANENPLALETPVTLNTKEDMGLSSNNKLVVAQISMMDGEGIISLWIEGLTEPMEMDDFDVPCIIDFVDSLEQQGYIMLNFVKS